jgi:dCMP deaminase
MDPKLINQIFKKIDFEKEKSRCLRSKVAAIIVKNNKIICKAHNGNSTKIPSCLDIGCAKNYFKPRPGQNNELCTGLCAEQRAILKALEKKVDLNNAILFCNYSPCTACSRIILEVGIKEIYYKKEYRDPLSKQILKMGKIKTNKI